jgi:hypothetical protein
LTSERAIYNLSSFLTGQQYLDNWEQEQIAKLRSRVQLLRSAGSPEAVVEILGNLRILDTTDAPFSRLTYDMVEHLAIIMSYEVPEHWENPFIKDKANHKTVKKLVRDTVQMAQSMNEGVYKQKVKKYLKHTKKVAKILKSEPEKPEKPKEPEKDGYEIWAEWGEELKALAKKERAKERAKEQTKAKKEQAKAEKERAKEQAKAKAKARITKKPASKRQL